MIRATIYTTCILVLVKINRDVFCFGVIYTRSVVNNVQGGMGSEGMSVDACLHGEEKTTF